MISYPGKFNKFAREKRRLGFELKSSGTTKRVVRRVGFQYTSVEKALELWEAEIQPRLAREEVPIKEAYRRILGEDIVSGVDIPPRNTSTLDGFAVKSSDLTASSYSAPVNLKIKGSGKLVEIPKSSLRSGDTFKVLTGGFLPTGADAVIGVEDVTIDSGSILVTRPVSEGQGRYSKGEDVRKGQLVFSQGHALRAQDLGLLALLGLTRVIAMLRPKVAIMPIGSELVDDLDSNRSDKIPATHNLVIAKLVEEAGGIPINLSASPDDVAVLRRRLEKALTEADIVLTIGGTSLGEADLVEDAVNSLGEPGVLVHGVKLDPGRVAGLGVVRGKPIILLPGLIQSTINAFIVFCLPALKMAGGYISGPGGSAVQATLTRSRPFRERFLDFTKVTYVKLLTRKGGLFAEPVTGETAMMRILTRADGFVLSPERKKSLRAGEMVRVNLLPGFSFAAG